MQRQRRPKYTPSALSCFLTWFNNNGPQRSIKKSPKEETVLTTFRNHQNHATRRAVVILAGVAAMFTIAGCHKKAAPPPPPPPVSNTGTQPTATITAQPDTISAGQSVVLTWHSTDATSATIEGLGAVPVDGTRTVQPTESTDYNLTVTGDGGNATATARVTVTSGANSSNINEGNVNDEVFRQNVKDVFYDYDSYDINAASQPTIQQNANFLNQHPDLKVVIGGYCDERGSTEYNLALGENRANAAKQALITAGVSPARLRTVSYGKEKQFCSEHNESCWQQNRRAGFSIDR
ncbi:MAG TPA: peptidoglycan-associated lipoprotein Pal [Silvibacterium sp.]|nr:peptidoglycan-associated lipoprotein Pal [Silvibacterium sp.]